MVLVIGMKLLHTEQLEHALQSHQYSAVQEMIQNINPADLADLIQYLSL